MSKSDEFLKMMLEDLIRKIPRIINSTTSYNPDDDSVTQTFTFK